MNPLAFLLALLGSGLMTFSSSKSGATTQSEAERNTPPAGEGQDNDTDDDAPVGTSDTTPGNAGAQGNVGGTEQPSNETEETEETASVANLVLVGTANQDFLTGQDGDDMIVAGGGKLDFVVSGGGSDVMQFSNISGSKDTLLIDDFDPDADVLDLNGAAIASTSLLDGHDDRWLLQLTDDQDQIVLRNLASMDGVTIINEGTAVASQPASGNTGNNTTNIGDTDTGQTATGNPVEAPDQSGSAANGEEISVQLGAGRVDVTTGRVTTLDPAGDDIASVRILSDVPHGNVTVNGDNSIALVMTNSDYTGNQSFNYEVTHTDGSTSTHTAQLKAVAGEQASGWATGTSHYMLATDENDKVIVEHGENHTKVYIGDGQNALSLQDIARAEGMNVSQINGDWLANSNYGQSENTALDLEAGMMLWETVTPRGSETSNWLLFERDGEYDDIDRLLQRNTHGESELNPIYIGAWGEGERPEIGSQFYQYQESSSNVVVQDIHFTGGIFITDASNMIFDNVKLTGFGGAFQHSEAITVRNSEFYDITREAPKNGEYWSDHSDRFQALFMNNLDGALIEGNLLDYNSWHDSYQLNADGTGNGDYGQTPSQWSHNIYFGADMTDVTLRDTISMRAASYGAQVRAGGFFEDNVFIDNNAGFTTVGGDYKGAGSVGYYSLMSGNIITSGAHKVATYIGALTLGLNDEGAQTTLIDNIVTHLADPNNPDELDYKIDTRHSVTSPKGAYYDDTIVYNWQGSKAISNPDIIPEQNTEGLDTNVLDDTTIQLFAAQLLGKETATIEELADYLRANSDGQSDNSVDADVIADFFKAGFGMDVDLRNSATTLRFEPDDLGDGVRWDNRLNWDAEDLPGLYGADDVDLAGNDVVYGTNTTIDELDFGPDGSLNVYGGKLNVDGGFSGDEGGSLNVEGAGQIWVDGSNADDLEITVDGGRFVNTGDFSGADLTVTGGETILAGEGGKFEVGASKTLAIFDEAAKVGFDGDNGGLAILDFDEGSTVAFKADNNDLGTIEEISSSAYDGSNVKSGIDLGKATLSIDLAGLSASNGASFTLMDADEIVGVFEDAIVGGLGNRNAKIVVDYETDSVTLELTSGNGQVNVETVGDAAEFDSGEQALWNALTADQGVYSEKDTPPVMEDEPNFLDDAA